MRRDTTNQATHRRFAGDESFKDVPSKSILDAGISLGVVVEGNNGSGKSHGKSSTGGSRL